ncbi:hypothetical protein LINGRAHAP2_LOCUS18655 [Linum grandiflorum]
MSHATFREQLCPRMNCDIAPNKPQLSSRLWLYRRVVPRCCILLGYRLQDPADQPRARGRSLFKIEWGVNRKASVSVVSKCR